MLLSAVVQEDYVLYQSLTCSTCFPIGLKIPWNLLLKLCIWMNFIWLKAALIVLKENFSMCFMLCSLVSVV